MAKVYDQISDEQRRFIERQPIFFVATAPLRADGHVNLSPKGMDTFRVLDANRVAYLDMTGSGNETSAHLRENGRITFMFCSFETAPLILRLYGRGETVLPGTPAWDELAPLFTLYTGARQIITARIHRVQTSCGFGVPLMTFESGRETMIRWAEAKGEEALETYRRKHNTYSVDGVISALGERCAQEGAD